MAEKYKIYIPEDVKSRLMIDVELFEFRKKDGSINLNAFLKKLLVNYFEEYQKKKVNLLNTVLTDLEEYPTISKSDAAAIADKIINTYMRAEKRPMQRSSAITLTVSGRSMDIIRSIENNLLTEKSLSQYIYDLFSSYLSVVRNNREKIIFRDKFEELEAAIKKKNIITFSTILAPKQIFTINPYMIVASKEEQCNYLLCTDTQQTLHTFRISRIQTLYTTSNKYSFDESVYKKLQEIAMRNPQYSMENVYAEVRLTERGIRKYSMMVKNRPDISEKKGDTYFFNCPKGQLLEYFRRFGYDAIIISPEDCRESMRSFYERSFEEYSKSII